MVSFYVLTLPCSSDGHPCSDSHTCHGLVCNSAKPRCNSARPLPPPDLAVGNLHLSLRDPGHGSAAPLLKLNETKVLLHHAPTPLWCVRGRMSEKEQGCWTSKWTSTKGPEVRERKGESRYCAGSFGFRQRQTDERGERKYSYSELFYYRVAKCFMYRNEEQREGK
ncbi:hypothetical protein F5148DRAFT_1251355 [Russula earlei]|uniref:Uncharacterized protein n=1 Tax=Russula earlei TaxID=71964 RepID=A0ACC0TVW6_9AGAM|nr:hypothetical protein F5148DRAFT_1251355 [Russula earlei]